MDRAWIDEVVEQLGKRYRASAGSESCPLEYRSGKSEFRATPVTLGTETDGRGLRLRVDVRIPKDAAHADAEPLLSTFESKTTTPRGFTRLTDETAEMTNQAGVASGWARTLTYALAGDEPAKIAKNIRAIIESVDLPIILGIHEDDDVVARDPRPPPPKPQVRADEALEVWRFRLDTGLTRDLSVLVDPNTRVLTVSERRFVSAKTVGEPLKLAHVRAFGVRGGRLIAVKREGDAELVIAEGSGGAEFVATARRLANKVRIPFVVLS